MLNEKGESISSEDGANKSGSKIYSQDSLDFWGDLKEKLASITFHELDSFTPKDKEGIVIDKNSGLITITALKSQLKRARSYIASLNSKLNKQVLIDVSILTLTHSNNKTTGINWQALYNLSLNGRPRDKDPSAPIISLGGSGFSFGVNVFSNNLGLATLIGFLKKYGQVQTLSNPKILTLNNQPALISVGNIIRYSQNLVFQSSNNQTTLQNTRELFPSVFAGVLLDITPTIANNQVMLKINPSVTSTKDVKLENQSNALSSPPNLATNQISSIIKLSNNQKVVLGGLISKVKTQTTSKIPFLGAIPLLGSLFTYDEVVDETKEMVIVISAKILN